MSASVKHLILVTGTPNWSSGIEDGQAVANKDLSETMIDSAEEQFQSIVNTIRKTDDIGPIHLVACLPNINCPLYDVLHTIVRRHGYPFRLVLKLQGVNLDTIRNCRYALILYGFREGGCWWRRRWMGHDDTPIDVERWRIASTNHKPKAWIDATLTALTMPRHVVLVLPPYKPKVYEGDMAMMPEREAHPDDDKTMFVVEPVAANVNTPLLKEHVPLPQRSRARNDDNNEWISMRSMRRYLEQLNDLRSDGGAYY